MDIKQEEITTLHDMHVDKVQLMKQVSDVATEIPVSVIMPMLYKEIKSDALANILNQLNKCTYLKEVIVPLAANSEEEFSHVKRFFSKLTIPKLIIWCNGPKITKILTELKAQGLDVISYSGKGRDLWIALGIASIESYGIAIHDADIQNYDETIPTKLLFPLLEPELDFKFNKGYYARTSIDKTILYGRVFRLFLHPLLRALVDVLDDEPDFIRFLRAFRYPISGEFALTSDLARDLDVPYGWGVEIGIMAEIYRNVTMKRVCQTDLGFYDHKHQEIGNSGSGLVKMTGDIFKSLLRILIEEDHIQIDQSFLLSLRVLYHKNAKNCIKKYHADARYNGIKYDRHLEESMMEQFSDQIMTAGQNYMLEPVYTRLPDWLRTISAKRKIREELLENVIERNKG